ncbi:DHA2 family lincomycin resistance protein-like MFS transporter [Actinocorallia herbida]|uniref:DHA2 family lincomycin resistance protein-like MFS transporter n=1 Tax=Actinocorallia herbida TaxID=58109 RepID=A0A3N1CXH7_9ACTN|nr:MDR family MFS transporter [Actinocorallia herbida]ROO85981.1 DHA2 family lincomycin resistance protein-like MFS transporter [Actinocorallia herbida]
MERPETLAEPSHIAEAADSGEPMPRHVKIAIGVPILAAFVMILNETVMGVAIPKLMTEFAVTATAAQWLTTGYLLTMAVVIPTTGLILQRFSTRSVFITATSLFAFGTLLAGLAPHFGVLLVARVVQASGTALVLPLLMTTILTLVPASRRGRTMGLVSVVIAVAPAVGPTFSGLILASLSWRWLFLAVLPIAAVTVIIGAALVKNSGTPRPVRFDLPSALLSAVAFGGLIYGLSAIGESAGGHAPVAPVFPLAAGAVALALFVARQLRLQREDAALLDLRPLRNRSFVIGVLLLLVAMGALFGALILLPIYLQTIRGLTTLETGLMLLPGGLMMGLVSPFVGRLADRFGPRPLVIPGTLALAVSLVMMSMLDASTPIGFAITAHVLTSLGLGFAMTPLMTSALGSLDADLYSHGSAIMNTLQQLAGAAGTALFITIMTMSSTSSAESGTAPLAAQSTGIQDAFLCGAVLGLLAIALSFLIKPVDKALTKEVAFH